MIVSSINFNLVSQRKNKTNLVKEKPNIAFCAQNLNENLPVVYSGPQTSLFFRKGFRRSFSDTVNAIRSIAMTQPKPKILVVGVGKTQEPLSYLAVIQTMFRNKPIETSVDLHCVDFQPKISDEKLAEYSKYSYDTVPDYALGGFVPNGNKYYPYKFKPEIIQYLSNVFNNPQKAHWNTRVEDFAATCPKGVYNMISINNVLMYIKDYSVRIKTMENIAGMLKAKGILITDENIDCYPSTYKFLSDFIHLAPGIWQKIR